VGFRGAIFSRVSEVAALHFRVRRAFVFWSMRYLNFRWPNEITIGGSEQKKPIDQSLGPPWLQSER
jgi:hypothetical protein